MIERAERASVAAGGAAARIGRAPIPREHGAWIILYAPMVMAFAAASRLPAVPALCLALACTGAIFAREAAGLLLRGRGRQGTGFWLAVYAAAFAAGAVPLFGVYARWDLLWVGAAAAGLFVVHSALLLWPARKRLDRSLWGELLGAGALALTAPAAGIAARGAAAPADWLLWGLSVLYFGSGIFNVKMLLGAARVKGPFGAADRRAVGRASLAYHLVLVTAAAATALAWGGWPGALVAAAFVPAAARAFWWMRHVSSRLPPLKRVGWTEAVYSLWFMACIVAALRLA